MKTKINSESDPAAAAAKIHAEMMAGLVAEIIPQVRERLGPARLAALDKTPMALARGGIEAVLLAACTECAGFPQPHISAAVRTLQLCGSVATKADLEGLATPE